MIDHFWNLKFLAIFIHETQQKQLNFRKSDKIFNLTETRKVKLLQTKQYQLIKISFKNTKTKNQQVVFVRVDIEK